MTSNAKHKNCFKTMMKEIGFPRVDVMFKVGDTPVVMSYGLDGKKWVLVGVDHGGYNTKGTPKNPEIVCGNCWKPISVIIPDLKQKIQFQVDLIKEMNSI